MASQTVVILLLFLITFSAAAVGYFWVYPEIQYSFDIGEASTIQQSFALCNQKIIQTARTGSVSNCIFSVKRGDMIIQDDSIHYSIGSSSRKELCDESGWFSVDNNIWKRCDSFGQRYSLMWFWPASGNITGQDFSGDLGGSSIDFGSSQQFMTISTQVEFDYSPLESGNVLEISRVNLTENVANLRIRIL